MTAPDEFRLTPGEFNEFNEIANFNHIPNKETPVNHHTEHIDPYGPPAQPLKPGLTPRGKAALGIGAAVLVGGSLIGYQTYSSNAAEKEAQASALQLKMQELRLEELKEQNRAAERNHVAEKKANSTLQASIDKCVNSKEDDANKGFGTTYRDIVDACKAQYASSADTGKDLETTAAAQDTSGGLNEGLLIGGGVLAIGLLLVVKRGPKPEKTPYHGCHHP